MEESRQLASFVSQLDYEDLPEAVIGKAKALILDQFGCQLAGSVLPWSRKAFEYVVDNKGAGEKSTIVHYGVKTTAQDAAFANACFGNAFLGDDTDSVCHGHLGSIVIPAALALGEGESVSGKEFIRAVVVGYEVASRIGAAAPSAEARGYHPGPIFGTFGAGAGVGAILGFNEHQMLNALGIAASHSSGLMEYSKSGGNVNRVHAGIAAYGGMRAALLAKRGFTGPGTILEGQRGFINAFSGVAALEEITRDLGIRYRVEYIDLKSHCCCGTSGASLDAVSKILDTHSIKADQIKEIIAKVTPATYRLTGSITRPKDITSAQFGGRFGIALRLIEGANTFREYTEENLAKPEILDLESKINIISDATLETVPRSDHPAQLTITLLDGKSFQETVHAPKGSVFNPMTDEEVFGKFRNFASVVLKEPAIEKIADSVFHIETEKDIRRVSQLLTVH